MKQLIENKVRVTFRESNGRVFCVVTYDLANDVHRRAMGIKCGQWQSSEVGNRVESEVISIRRDEEVAA